MTQRLKFNLHVGVSRIASGLLHLIADQGLLKSHPKTIILSRRAYREKLRNHVNLEFRTSKPNFSVSRATEEFVRRISICELVVISQHAMLGHPEDLFRKRRALSIAAERIARLSQLFPPDVSTFHLAIAPQLDYFYSNFQDPARNFLASASDKSPSWYDVVRRLKSAANEHKFVVWDFERPVVAARAFLGGMLDTVEHTHISTIHDVVKQASDIALGAKDDFGIVDIGSDIIEQLDELYETDLLRIEQMTNVSLIRSDGDLMG